MTEVLHANIFFFIASLATVTFVILVSIAMYQVIKILQSIRAILSRIEQGSDMIAEDIQAARDFVAAGGIISYLMRFMTGASRRKARTSKKTKDITISDSK